MKIAYNFIMNANTGKWGYEYPIHEYGVICKYGKFLREFCGSNVAIYDRTIGAM